MPTVPNPQSINPSASGESPLTSKPSPENLLMAIATMHQMGKFGDSSPKLRPKGQAGAKPR